MFQWTISTRLAYVMTEDNQYMLQNALYEPREYTKHETGLPDITWTYDIYS